MNQKIIDIMKALPLFAGLEKNELEMLAQKCAFPHFQRGELLFSAGYPATDVYIILTGSVKLVRAHPDGKERIVHLLLRGEMFGAPVAMQGGYYPVNAIALEQSTIMKIVTTNFQELFLKHPKVGQILIAQMSERMQQAHSDRVLSYDAVEKRIAWFLIDLLERIQKNFSRTSRIPIPLTRQDIADRVGSTVETVIRTLSTWSKQNLIDTQDKYIEIPSIPALRKAANLDT